jgi:RimJ/RimL family protein N-acetyltransferase
VDLAASSVESAWTGDVVLRDGESVRVRPVRPDDGPALEALHSGLSKESVYFRYFSARRVLPQSQIDEFTHLDYRDRMGFVVEFDGELIAHGCYHRREQTTEAEVAFEVAERHWGRGLATVLLHKLAEAARRSGLTRLTAHVLTENHRMLDVFHDAGLPHRSRFEDGAIAVDLEL